MRLIEWLSSLSIVKGISDKRFMNILRHNDNEKDIAYKTDGVMLLYDKDEDMCNGRAIGCACEYFTDNPSGRKIKSQQGCNEYVKCLRTRAALELNRDLPYYEKCPACFIECLESDRLYKVKKRKKKTLAA